MNKNTWENGTVTITRKEYKNIVVNEMTDVLAIAVMTGLDENLIEFLKELLMQFSANVASEVFNDERTLEVE